MKIPVKPILKWIFSTLLTAAVQKGAESLAQSARSAKADRTASEEGDA